MDWVYIDDMVEAFIASVTTDAVLGETLDVSSCVVIIRTVVEEIVQLRPPSVEVRFGALPDRPNERVRVADVERTHALLGWALRTRLKEGLAATVP